MSHHLISPAIAEQTDYTITMMATWEITPAPENDDIYGEVAYDEQMKSLIESIRVRGLEEPLIITADHVILSGHRRYYACCALGLAEIPVRIKSDVHYTGNDEYHRLLIEYNPQRIKTAGSLLKEALLRLSDKEPEVLLNDHRRASIEVDAEFLPVAGIKGVQPISDKKMEFLAAAKSVVDGLRKFWPLSIRQVHYSLLNHPPLITTPKRSKFKAEHYRYRNDKTSYDALIELMKQARYLGEIPMSAIDDATRPRYSHDGFSNVSEFIQREMDNFLCGYHRDLQLDQPRHIEMLGEKNTLMQILKPVCQEYYVPLTLGRGYASIPVWRDVARRFKESGKDAMTLIVASDYDPEGFDLADDGVRSLRDLWSIPVDYHRIAVIDSQITELGLHADFNPAKETSSRLDSFVARTGDSKTWELEALPPEFLQEQARAAIEANMDMAIYEKNVEDERADAKYLADFRQQLVEDFNF